jgi:uncharacterized membrane protein
VKRVFTDIVLAAGGVVLLLLVLAAIDPRVRDQFTWQNAARPTADFVDTGARVRATVNVAYRAAKEQTEEHTALAIFTVAGVVLLVFMIRS